MTDSAGQPIPPLPAASTPETKAIPAPASDSASAASASAPVQKPAKNFFRGDVWMAHNVPARGDDPDELEPKDRPVLILQTERVTAKRETVIVVVITTKTFRASGTTEFVKRGAGGLQQDSLILCDQIYSLNKTRFINKIGSLPASVLHIVCTNLRAILEIK